jgi:hypothetical protein
LKAGLHKTVDLALTDRLGKRILKNIDFNDTIIPQMVE